MQDQVDKVLEFLIEQRDSVSNLRDGINKDIGEKRIDNIKQRREFFKHLTILTGIILGLSALIKPELLNSGYFLAGLTLHLLVILFVNLYIRETLDKEGEELQLLQDRYSEINEERINLIDKYLGYYPNLDVDKLKQYNSESNNLKGLKILDEDNKKLSEERKSRADQFLDFSGELCAFLFVTGTFFIVLSIANKTLPWWALLFLIIVVFYLTFSDSSLKIIYPISKFASFLKKKGILLSYNKRTAKKSDDYSPLNSTHNHSV